ncbi:hypothetical protein ACFCX4_05460 [Kitasatospora sp. NPDC056327]|uniref:hypothetical protein n=1 Tax=Kitasatospora sp. NPDC056327 TaxID=3345785 RepID=UPI0035DE611A
MDVDPADPDPWIAVVADGCHFPGGRSLCVPVPGPRWTLTPARAPGPRAYADLQGRASVHAVDLPAAL